jgi:hypothetical protein
MNYREAEEFKPPETKDEKKEKIKELKEKIPPLEAESERLRKALENVR